MTFSPEGVDRLQIWELLHATPAERLAAMEALSREMELLRRATAAALGDQRRPALDRPLTIAGAQRGPRRIAAGSGRRSVYVDVNIGGMKRTTIYLEPELEALLKAETLRRKQPMAELVRAAVREYLVRSRPAPPPGAGAFASGDAGTAERAEEVLAETGFGRAGSEGAR